MKIFYSIVFFFHQKSPAERRDDFSVLWLMPIVQRVIPDCTYNSTIPWVLNWTFFQHVEQSYLVITRRLSCKYYDSAVFDRFGVRETVLIDRDDNTRWIKSSIYWRVWERLWISYVLISDLSYRIHLISLTLTDRRWQIDVEPWLLFKHRRADDNRSRKVVPTNSEEKIL